MAILVQGRTDKEIAATLGLSRRTVSNYVSVILLKLNAYSRTEAVSTAIQLGLVTADGRTREIA